MAERIGFTFTPDNNAANITEDTDVDVSTLIPDRDISQDQLFLLYPNDGLEGALAFAGARITRTNNLRIYMANLTGSASDSNSARDWTGYLFKPGDFRHESANYTPVASLGANTLGSADISFSFNFDILPSDMVIAVPADGLETTLAYAGNRMITTNTLRIYIMNVSEGTVSGAALVWDFYFFKNWNHDAFSFNPASVAANTQAEELTALTFQGQNIQFSAPVVLSPPDSLNTGLMYAGSAVPRNNAFNIFLGNATSGAINDTALTWDIFWRNL